MSDERTALKRAQLADLRAAHPTPSPYVQAIIDRLAEELDPTPVPVTYSEEDVSALYARISDLQAEVDALRAELAARPAPVVAEPAPVAVEPAAEPAPVAVEPAAEPAPVAPVDPAPVA